MKGYKTDKASFSLLIPFTTIKSVIKLSEKLLACTLLFCSFFPFTKNSNKK